METQRLLVRPFQPEDVQALYAILGDAETMEHCEPPYTLEKTQQFLKDFCIDRQGALAATLRDSGALVGYILFKETDAGVYEIGWIFRRDCWRQGYAFEACSAVVRCAFERLHAHKLMAEAIDGVKSVGLMEKLGMRREGVQRSHVRDKYGRWCDLYLYGMLREDWNVSCLTDIKEGENHDEAYPDPAAGAVPAAACRRDGGDERVL